MQSLYSKIDLQRAIQTFQSVKETIIQLTIGILIFALQKIITLLLTGCSFLQRIALLSHGYFELDADIVFEAVKNDIPPLKEIIQKAEQICLNSI